VSHGFSGFTNDGHRNRTSRHSQVLHDRPEIGMGSTGIALPRQILVLATGIAHLGRRVTASSRFVSLPLNLSRVLSLPSASLPQQISLYLRFSFSPNLSVSSLCLYSLTLSVRVLGGRNKKKELKEEEDDRKEREEENNKKRKQLAVQVLVSFFSFFLFTTYLISFLFFFFIFLLLL